MDKKITLQDYFLWVVGGDENEITAWEIASQLGIDIYEWDNDQIMAFYEKYKNSELVDFTEEYNSPDRTYRGLGYCETVISFSIDDMKFKITDMDGSYLHDLADSEQKEILLSKKRMVEWAGELKELYDSANSDTDFANCADAMVDFIDEFLKIYKEK